jgi:uncharacterized protein involved in outer membrane biogenesis
MNNLLVAIAVFVITVVGALFAIPHFVDWNSYRPFFEEEATRIVGRDVQVDGDVKLYLLPTPYFSIEKVRIADTTGGLREPFFRTDSLTVKLSIAPMLRGIVEANDIEFQRPTLRLAVDKRGQWNWQSFAEALGKTAYMPTSVTLSSLKIENGVLAVHGPDGIERTRLERLKGELSAPALNGPYRFRGTFVSDGGERELRLATAPPEADGGIRMRASLRLADSGAAYLVDARLADLMGTPRLDGQLSARLPIAGLWGSPPSLQPAAPKQAEHDDEIKIERGDAAFDLKAQLKADAGSAELSDLTLSFEQDGRPQLVTGTVQMNWREAVSLEMRLASRWLDLDRITGASAGSGPRESVAKIAAGLRDVLPGYRSRILLGIDQANLAGDVIGNVQLSLNRSTGAAELEFLRASLPGGTRGQLKGVITGKGSAIAFTGGLSLHGASASRFLVWASGSGVAIDPKGDGTFSLDTQLALTSGRIEAKEVVGNISGSMLKGVALYSWEGRPQLTIRLEGPRLDARPIVPRGADLPRIYTALASHAPEDGVRRMPDVTLDLRTASLLTADRSYQNVAASIETRDGHLKKLLLKFSGEAGYSLEFSGRVDHRTAKPKGAVHGVVAADSPAGLDQALDLLGIPETARMPDFAAAALVPLRLAGSLTFAGRSPTSTDLVAGGEAKGMNLNITARLDGGPADWREQRADVTITVESRDRASIAKLLSPLAPEHAGDQGRGRLLIKGTGIPSRGLGSVARVEAGDIRAEFQGKATVAGGAIKLAGTTEVQAGDGAQLAALIGATLPFRMEGQSLFASADISLDGGKVDLPKLALQIGEARISGKAAIAPSGNRHHVDAFIQADELNVGQLFAPLLDQRLAVAGMAEAAIAGKQSPWPDEPFSATAMDALEGSIDVSSRRLVLAERLALDEARLKVELAAGRVEVKELTGTALGGQISAKLDISKVGAGAELRGGLELSAALERLTGEAAQSPSGLVKAAVEFSGRGASPRAIAAALQGKGKVQFKDARVSALWPGAVAAAADAGLKTEPDKLAATVRQSIAAALTSGSIPLGPRSIALEIVDGQLRTKSVVIETDEGRASGIVTLDLGSLSFRSPWRLDAKSTSPGPAAKSLPGVTVEYGGPIASLGKLAPRIDSAALEQELSARRIERDVEELERLRRLDEQRRQIEAERLRKQFDPTPPVQRPPLPIPITPSGRDQRPASPG